MTHSPTFTRGVLAALLGALTFAAGAPLVKTASRAMSPETLTGLRMLLAAAGIFVLAGISGATWRIPAHRRRAVALVAFVTFVHFYAFIASFYYTTPLRSLALTYLAPVWTFLAWLISGGRIPGEPVLIRICGILLTLAGVIGLLSAGGSGTLLTSVNQGDIFAIISGMALSAYHFLGGRIRLDTPLLAYAGWVYLGSVLPFLPLYAGGAWAMDLSQTVGLLALLGVALLPTVGGHTLINYSLEVVPAPLVSLIATLEIPGGALLAAVFTGDVPTVSEWLFAGLAVTGLIVYYVQEGRIRKITMGCEDSGNGRMDESVNTPPLCANR